MADCPRGRAYRPAAGGAVLSEAAAEGGAHFLGRQNLLGRDLDTYVVQILSPEAMDPELAGDLRLLDVEDQDVAEVTVSRALLNRYKQNLQAYCGSLKEYCTRRGISYLFTGTDVPFDQLVLSYLRRRGLLK